MMRLERNWHWKLTKSWPSYPGRKQLELLAHDGTQGSFEYGDANKQFPVPTITKELGGQMLTVHIGIQRCKDFIRLRFGGRA